MTLSRRDRLFEQHFRRKLSEWDYTSPWPGVVVCLALAAIAYIVQTLPFPPFTLSGGQHPLEAVLLALLLGLILRNTIPATARLRPGADFVLKKLLPAGIVLLGARLDFYDLLRVGLRVLIGATILIGLIILVTRFLAARFHVGEKQGLLIAVGTAICGNSAIVATAPVIDAKEEDIVISLTAISLLGAFAMLVFPFAGALLRLDPAVYGEWCGLAIHATPQVIAAGFSHPTDGQTAGEIATIVKLTRISLLGPAVFVVGAIYGRSRQKDTVVVGPQVNYRQLLPTFILVFIAMALLRTLGMFPEVTLHMTDRFIFGAGSRTFDLASVLSEAGKWIITAAMAAVGLLTQFRSLKSGGAGPFLLGLASAVLLALTALLYASWQ
jgi:uncharacterized integral membrane protein (TIGR00698 family)